MDLADWYAQLEQPEFALEYYQGALELKPDDPQAQYAMLKDYLSCRKEEDTRFIIEKAVSIKVTVTKSAKSELLLDCVIEDGYCGHGGVLECPPQVSRGSYRPCSS